MLNNQDFHELIKEFYARAPGNDIEGMHRGIALELGTFIPTLYRPSIINIHNVPLVENNIKIDIIIDSDRSLTFLLEDPEKIESRQQKKFFIGDGVQNVSAEEFTSVHYEYNNSAVLSERTLVLMPTILSEIIIAYVRNNPQNILLLPDNEEELMPASNIEVIVTYDTVDGDGVLHEDVAERHFISVPSLDQITPNAGNTDIEIKPISPNSLTAKKSIAIYRLAEKDIISILGQELYDRIVNTVILLDNSPWEKTEADITFFDDKYISQFIIEKAEFDSGEFGDTRVVLTI